MATCMGHDCEQPTHKSAGNQLDLISRLANEGVEAQARVKRLEKALRQIRQLCVSGSPTRHLVEAALAERDTRQVCTWTSDDREAARLE